MPAAPAFQFVFGTKKQEGQTNQGKQGRLNVEAKLYVPVSTSWADAPVRLRLGVPFSCILRRGKDLASSSQVRAWHLNFDATERVRVEPIHSYRMLVLEED